MNKIAISLGMTLAIGCTGALAADTLSDGPAPRPVTKAQTSSNADNTGMNQRDKDGTKPTAQTQNNAGEDLTILTEVRRAVVDEKSLSVMAQNVKIMVQDGIVTLRGPVKNEAEKEKVASLAQSVTGVGKVDNQLDIKTP